MSDTQTAPFFPRSVRLSSEFWPIQASFNSARAPGRDGESNTRVDLTGGRVAVIGAPMQPVKRQPPFRGACD